MAGKKVVKTVMEFILGIALLPTAAAYAVFVTADTNLSGFLGLNLIINIGIIVVALGIIYNTAGELFGK